MAKFNNMIAESEAPEDVKPLYAQLSRAMGKPYNIYKIYAHSPSCLKAVNLMGAEMRNYIIPLSTQQKIGIQMAEFLKTKYCKAFHIHACKNWLGVEENEIHDAIVGISKDPKEQILLKITKSALENHCRDFGNLIEEAKKLGLTEGEISEACWTLGYFFAANVASHVTNVELDEDLDQDILTQEKFDSTFKS